MSIWSEGFILPGDDGNRNGNDLCGVRIIEVLNTTAKCYNNDAKYNPMKGMRKLLQHVTDVKFWSFHSFTHCEVPCKATYSVDGLIGHFIVIGLGVPHWW